MLTDEQIDEALKVCDAVKTPKVTVFNKAAADPDTGYAAALREVKRLRLQARQAKAMLDDLIAEK